MEKKEKKAKKRTTKNADELRKAHIRQTEHCVLNVDKWLGKAVKAAMSKRHKLTDEQKNSILGHVSESYEGFAEAIQGAKEIKTGFKLE